mmetsp:Transcript_45627/g.111061  ORF Transcript_45627/g.111061 Transcript_45627/m.111061 type:complete len:555 (+) Transcript_45627:36-1700(+)
MQRALVLAALVAAVESWSPTALLAPPRPHGLQAACGSRRAEQRISVRALWGLPPGSRFALRTPATGARMSAGEAEAKVGEEAAGLVERARVLQKEGAPRKLIACLDGLGEAVPVAEEQGQVVEAVIRGLIKLQRFDLVADTWKRLGEEGLAKPDELATVVVKAICRAHKGGLATAMEVISELEAKGEGAWREVYPVACQAAIKQGHMHLAVDLARRLFECRDAAPVETYNFLIKEFGKASCMRGVFVVLDAMHAAEIQPDAETFEFIANAAVRQVEFVTGAVSMETLPEPMPEACFAGRSNVGKSSLVNMLTNRKKLAFKSKTPGKTQQFNYFRVNGEDAAERQFYLVDLPGVGYAEVPLALRRDWVSFLTEYMTDRESLKVLFHLVDSRHGVMKDDKELMSLYSSTGCKARYVVLLTKVDKLDGKVREEVVVGVREALVESGCSADTPIVTTSSETKRGRDEVWGHLRLAALPEGEYAPEALRECVAGDLRIAAEEAEARRQGAVRQGRKDPTAKRLEKLRPKKEVKKGIRRKPFNGQELYVKPSKKTASANE